MLSSFTSRAYFSESARDTAHAGSGHLTPTSFFIHISYAAFESQPPDAIGG
jgi:hypothetical protein